MLSTPMKWKRRNAELVDGARVETFTQTAPVNSGDVYARVKGLDISSPPSPPHPPCPSRLARVLPPLPSCLLSSPKTQHHHRVSNE